MIGYPPIADHGVIGDLQTAALVSRQGLIDWWCTPRFDSPSLFAALLDRERGGYCRLAGDLPADDEVSVRQLYMPDTAVLVTRVMAPGGVGEVADFMVPDRSPVATDRHRIIRAARVVRGSVPFAFACRPRFDYGRARHELSVLPDGSAVFRGPGVDLWVQPVGTEELVPDDGDITASFTLRAVQTAAFILTAQPSGEPAPSRLTISGLREEFETTRDFWLDWLQSSTYRGRWSHAVHRSAITLKLLTYAPTGAPIAAATTGLPERIGGERNWDYRYTWIRDASLSVRALIGLGFTKEAGDFGRWMVERFTAESTETGEPLQIMYRVDGDPHLPEEVLSHLEGYRGSSPVRIGNAAADQIQLDIYGEAAYAFGQSADMGRVDSWRALVGIMDWFSENWDRADEGIWETRGGRQDFTFSRLMAWVAFDQAIRLARVHSRPADLPRWTKARDAVFNQVIERGWHRTRQAFVQHYDTDVLDASLLLMPRVGFISPHDPLWLSTLAAIERDLVRDSLVFRYDPDVSPDGLTGAEGTFNLCTFLYVEALAESGQLHRARYAFEKMLTYANHVGLFAEEIGHSGEQLGNFPQAFTHAGLIAAAITLDRHLDSERRRAEPR